MKDVADRAGVSRQLVSLVLRDLPGASLDSRARVLAAAEAIGYRIASPAAARRGVHGQRVGVLFSMHQSFEVDLVEAMLAAARGAGYTLILGALTPELPQSEVARELIQQRVEALIVLGADGDAASAENLPNDVPIITVGGPVSSQAMDDIRVDDEASMRQVVEYLSRLGHRSITHVSGGLGPNADVRRNTYVAAMAERGLSDFSDVVESAFTEDAGSAAAEILLRRTALPTAIIACNDRAAVGILETLLRGGARIPEDVSLVGFDDSTAARLSFVQLTTMHHDPEHLAVRAMAAITRRIAQPGAEPSRQLVQPRLVIRKTSGEPRL